MATPDLLSSNIREDLRIALRQALESRLYAKTVARQVATNDYDERDRDWEPEGWSPVPVISRREWTDVLWSVFGEQLPEPDERTAEVRTPSEVLVWAFCPRCKMPAAIRLFVSPVLTIDSTGSQLKLKASSKATYHVCGQQTLPARPDDVADGQEELPLEEPDAEDGPASPEPADDDPRNAVMVDAEPETEAEPWVACGADADGRPCELTAGHDGDHDPDPLAF